MSKKPGKISLRPAFESDIPFLMALRDQTMRAVVEYHYPWDDETQRKRVRIHLDHARVIVLSGQDVGLWKVVWRDDVIELLQIQVLPSFQRMGIGRQLISDLQFRASESGLPIELHVFQSNRAIGLYESLGFYPIIEDENSMIMRWTPKIDANKLKDNSSG